MPGGNQMTYFKSVQDKTAVWLNGPNFTDVTKTYAIHCCGFHGCGGNGANGTMWKWCNDHSAEAHGVLMNKVAR